MIISWKKPDQLFNEVKVQKMNEMAQYKQKSNDGKLKDIRQLLHMMNGGKKSDPLPDEEKGQQPVPA